MPRDDPDRERRRRSSHDPESERDRRRERDPDRQRRRKTHRATDSQGDLLPKHRDRSSHDYESSTPRSSNRRHSSSRGTDSSPLKSGSLAQLDSLNAKQGWKQNHYDGAYLQEVRDKESRLEKERRREEREIERERRRADKDAEREERRRMQELQEQRELEAERQRLKEEEREKRREEKRRLKRLEKDRQREIEDERALDVGRESERDTERERLKQARKNLEREQRRREMETRDDRDDDSSEDRHRDRPRRHSKYAEVNQESPRGVKEHSREYSPRKKARVVSGPYLEDGRRDEVYEYRKEKLRDDTTTSDYTTDTQWTGKRKKRICIIVTAIVIILLIAIPVGVVVSKNKGGTPNFKGGKSGTSNANLNGVSESSIPASAKGGILDPFSWLDTKDFNVTYTDVLVGGLPVMGLNTTWNDNVQANKNVPSLKDEFAYGSMPIRGMNLGGWLSLEPFITPSFFSTYKSRDGVIDEYTLTKAWGPSKTAKELENHYATFVTAQTFADIRAAGFDHVRIPFSYWAVTTYPGDPYLAKVSWRYLLRAIEWARHNGLRINLDLHGAPGSQNGWNHSGRQGVVGWLNGTDGTLNGQRTIDIHKQLTTFFTQPRYTNIITVYGLVNEPRMTGLDRATVLAWTVEAVKTIRANNMTAVLVFGDGFMGLDNWQGQLQIDDKLVLDVHQYVIFNNDQISLSHEKKLNFACGGWTQQMARSQNKNSGFGPTMCGEWSQADTDCAQYLNNVGIGTRWDGTLNTGNASTQVLSPQCPTKNDPLCACTNANADPSKYSTAYKQWLLYFALAQMESFETGWGWFYWTWKTETATQWSWQLGMKAEILPKTVQDRSFTCKDKIPDFAGMGLPENY
ncbi:glycoside hydrolase [Tothia fuscella]|uniref:glucan 1,3-beta-glucosidase n=1 Tax=Tothia fuscella TaxID=1048955 RepID=A0A9P4NFB0_9PEZI|nr:glycoside hydrolase [Tothia fuscella]